MSLKKSLLIPLLVLTAQADVTLPAIINSQMVVCTPSNPRAASGFNLSLEKAISYQ